MSRKLSSAILYMSTICISALCFGNCSASHGTNTSSKQITNAISNRQFTFVAEQALPQDYSFAQILNNTNTLSLLQLSNDYQITVNPTRIEVDLPFFGRAYQAPIPSDKGGFKSVINHFKYDYSKASKNGFINIRITPKNDKELEFITLKVSENGKTIVTVVSNQKQPMSFLGTIKISMPS